MWMMRTFEWVKKCNGGADDPRATRLRFWKSCISQQKLFNMRVWGNFWGLHCRALYFGCLLLLSKGFLCLLHPSTVKSFDWCPDTNLSARKGDNYFTRPLWELKMWSARIINKEISFRLTQTSSSMEKKKEQNCLLLEMLKVRSFGCDSGEWKKPLWHSHKFELIGSRWHTHAGEWECVALSLQKRPRTELLHQLEIQKNSSGEGAKRGQRAPGPVHPSIRHHQLRMVETSRKTKGEKHFFVE